MSTRMSDALIAAVVTQKSDAICQSIMHERGALAPIRPLERVQLRGSAADRACQAQSTVFRLQLNITVSNAVRCMGRSLEQSHSINS